MEEKWLSRINFDEIPTPQLRVLGSILHQIHAKDQSIHYTCSLFTTNKHHFRYIVIVYLYPCRDHIHPLTCLKRFVILFYV